MNANISPQQRLNDSLESATTLLERISRRFDELERHIHKSATRSPPMTTKARYNQPPSDDGEPISREWVAEHFGDKWGRIEIGPHRILVYTPGEVDIHCHDEPLTRGQFRQLLAALGWRGEEKR